MADAACTISGVEINIKKMRYEAAQALAEDTPQDVRDVLKSGGDESPLSLTEIWLRGLDGVIEARGRAVALCLLMIPDLPMVKAINYDELAHDCAALFRDGHKEAKARIQSAVDLLYAAGFSAPPLVFRKGAWNPPRDDDLDIREGENESWDVPGLPSRIRYIANFLSEREGNCAEKAAAKGLLASI